MRTGTLLWVPHIKFQTQTSVGVQRFLHAYQSSLFTNTNAWKSTSFYLKLEISLENINMIHVLNLLHHHRALMMPYFSQSKRLRRLFWKISPWAEAKTCTSKSLVSLLTFFDKMLSLKLSMHSQLGMKWLNIWTYSIYADKRAAMPFLLQRVPAIECSMLILPKYLYLLVRG